MTFIQRNQQNSLFGSQSWTSCSLPCASSSPEVQSRWCRGWLSLTSTVKRVTFPGAWKWRFRQYHIRIESLYILLTFLLWRSTKIFANLCHWKHFLYPLRTEQSLRTCQWVLYLVLPGHNLSPMWVVVTESCQVVGRKWVDMELYKQTEIMLLTLNLRRARSKKSH